MQVQSQKSTINYQTCSKASQKRAKTYVQYLCKKFFRKVESHRSYCGCASKEKTLWSVFSMKLTNNQNFIDILEFQFSIWKPNFILEMTKTISPKLEFFHYTHKMLHCNENK